MIASQYKAAQLAGVSKQTINRWSRENPRPGYFIDIPGAVEGTPPKVDTEHPEFKMYCDKIKSDRVIDTLIKSKTEGTTDEDIMKVFDAVDLVITREYSEEEAGRIKGLIVGELE